MSEKNVTKEDQTSNVNGEIVTIEFKNFKDDAKTIIKNYHLFVVKSEYIKNHPDYPKYNSIELFKQTEIQKFLHNPNGPALIDQKNSIKNYFLDGQLITEDSEEFKKIKHNEMFNNKVDQILAE